MSKSENRQKAFRISSRVNEKELSEIEAKASKCGLSIGSYVRCQCLDKPKTRAVHSQPIELLNPARILELAGKIRTHIDQSETTEAKNKLLEIAELAMKALGE